MTLRPLLFFSAFWVGTMLPQHEAPKLSLRDTIDIVADYSVYHPDVPFRQEWAGWTDPDEQKMFIVKNLDLTARRRTTIHELVHVQRRMYRQIADTREAEEVAVDLITEATYIELFGAKP